MDNRWNEQYKEILFDDEHNEMLYSLLKSNEIALIMLNKIKDHTYIDYGSGVQQGNGITKKGLRENLTLPSYIKDDPKFKSKDEKLSRKLCDDAINLLTGATLIYYREQRREKLYQATMRGLLFLNYINSVEGA